MASRLIKEAGFENVSNTAMINRLIDLSFISNEIGYQDGKYNRHKRRPSFAWILSKAITKLKFLGITILLKIRNPVVSSSSSRQISGFTNCP